jgi:hypothetical protein
MIHRLEMDTIFAQVSPWPMEERVALANQILGDLCRQTRQPAPRRTLERAMGIAAGASAPPGDALVRQWIEEHRLREIP